MAGVLLSDALTLDAPRRTSDGYLAVRARAARTGVYSYSGAEIDPDNAHGLRDQASVNVLRDDAAVFDAASVRSFIGKPITDDHPREAVTASNWRDHARGAVMGAMRDGDHLAFDLVLMDAPTIAKVEAGKVELSNGYGATLEFGDFAGPGGEKCAARQTGITGNHIAIVDRGRAGPTCRIGDAATCGSIPLPTIHDQEKPVKKIMLDGLTVDIGDAETAESTVRKLEAERNDARAKLADADKEVAKRDTEITELKTKVADQAAIDAMADAKAEVVAKGKALLGDAMPDTKGKTAAQVRRAVVLAVTKDNALADKSDDYIESRFDGLKTDAKPGATGVQPLGNPGGSTTTASIRDAARAAAAMH